MSLTLQLREREKQIEKLKESLKGNTNWETVNISLVLKFIRRKGYAKGFYDIN